METTKQVDLGVDFSLFQNRIDLVYDFYTKRTTNLLYNFDIPTSSGFSTFTGNSGEFKFWGHEIALTTRNLVGDFKWNTNLNLSFNDNEVIAMAEGVTYFIPSGGGNGGSGHIVTIGERLGLFWGLEQDGVYDNQTEWESSPKHPGSSVGSVKFKDLDGSGDVVLDNLAPGGDYHVIGDPTPKFLFGMTNSFTYKGFDLAVTMSGSYGNDICNRAKVANTNLDGTFNVLREVKDRWMSESNPGKGLYGSTAGNTGPERDNVHSAWIEDGSFVTVKNVTLGYRFNVSKVNFLKSVRVYASGQQLLTLTNYSGNNPEIATDVNGGSVSVITMGDDFSSYPIPRTFTFGIDVQF
jgi:hypothetical protein